MLTGRGFALLLVGLVGAGLAAAYGQRDALVLAVVALGWIGSEAVIFVWRCERIGRRVRIERFLGERPAHRAVVWSHLPVDIEIRAVCPGRSGLGQVRIADRPPALGTVDRPAAYSGRLPAGSMLLYRGRFRAEAPGIARFEGAALEVLDGAGLFSRRLFIPSPAEIVVLPAATEAGDSARLVKRLHFLPGQGIHRHRRPGSGVDLLDLRDYVPGDPPKTIAWKLSARRETLIVKQYESDVPVRCSLIVDATDSVRLGPLGRTELGRWVELAAGLAGDILASRDPVGLCLVEPDGTHVLPPALGSKQWFRIVHRLAEAAGRPPGPQPCPIDAVLPAANSFCRQIHPELFEPELHPQSIGSALWSSLRWSLMPALSTLASVIAVAAVVRGFTTGSIWPLAVAVANALFVGTWSFLRVRRGLQAKGSLSAADRRRLASVLAVLSGGGPAEAALLAEDDAEMSIAAQRFLAEHRQPFPRPLYGEAGEPLFRSEEKIPHMRRFLLRAVAHGRDNELFVLLVDLLDLANEWGPLLSAIKVAVARHHQVVIVLPAGTDSSTGADDADPIPSTIGAPDRLARSMRARRRRSALSLLELESTRLGATVLAMGPSDTPRKIRERLERMRQARASVHSRRLPTRSRSS